MVAYEFSNLSQLVTRASRIESCISEDELERSNYTIVSSDDSDVFDDAFVYHVD